MIAQNGLSRDEVVRMLEGDEKKADAHFEVVKLIGKYNFIQNARELGVTFDQSSFSFSEIIIFSWIREAKSGRKN